MDPAATSAAASAPAKEPLDLTSSPASGFVTVLTPVSTPVGGARLDSDEEFDVNGVRMHVWTSELRADAHWSSSFAWWTWLCPCVPLAQLQVRLGVSRAYAASLLVNAVLYAGRLACLVAALACFVRMWTHAPCVAGFFVSAALFIFCTLAVAHRVSTLRVLVRERLAIPGSPVTDRKVACMHSARAIRQLAHQLKCDRARLGAPATLQAYEV